MSLRNGTQKMSKSEESDLSRINLTDDADLISKKIQKAKTDSEPINDNIILEKNRPEARNLINIFAAFKNEKVIDIINLWSGKNFSEFKKELSQLLIEKICPIGAEIKKLKSNKDYLQKILEEGKMKATIVANKNLKEIKQIIGLAN